MENINKIKRARFLNNSASPRKFIPIENNKLWNTYPLETENWENKEIFTVDNYNIGDETKFGIINKFDLVGETIVVYFQDETRRNFKELENVN